MRRLFVFLDFHPSLEPVQFGSFWCHRTALDLDLTASFPLASLPPLALSDLKPRLLLKSSAAPGAAAVAFCALSLPPGAAFDADLPSVPLIGPSSGEIGLLSVNVAVKEIPNPAGVAELRARRREAADWKCEALRHGWRSVQAVQQRWEEMALHFGWAPPRRRSFDVKHGDRLTIEPRPYVCVVPRAACSIGPQRVTPYAMIQRFRLRPDFEEKHAREHHSQRGFAFPNLLVEVRPGEYESEPERKPSTFEPPEETRREIVSDVVFQFSGGRRSLQRRALSKVEEFAIPGIPPIVKSPSLERMLDAGEVHLALDFSDCSEEESE
jgi:hypothetical protein